MPIPFLTRALFAFASVVAVPALAQTFSCPEIKAVLAEADRDFAVLKGRQLKKETAEDFARANGLPAGKQDFKYQRLIHEAKKPLSGPVTACQVVEAHLEDDESTIRQSSYECQYDPKSSAAKITPAMRKQLHGCVGGEVDPDSDNESLVVHVDRAASGEGARSVSVELDANPAVGAKLSIRKLVCLKKAPTGCDDE
jgi:hypothetical protein